MCFSLAFWQSIYFIPSINQHTPKGKLYYRVVSLLAKHRGIGGDTTRKRRCIRDKDDVTSMAFLDGLDEGC